MKAGGTSEGPQEAEHPEWKSKLSLFAASWSQMLKCNKGKKGCWEAVQEHSVSAGKSNQMQQECDLFSERWEAQLLGHMRRLKMRLKFKLTVWVRGISPVWSFLMYLEGLTPPSLSWHRWRWRPWGAAELRVHCSGQGGLTRGPRVKTWQGLPALRATVRLCLSPSHHLLCERKGSSTGKLKQSWD